MVAAFLLAVALLAQTDVAGAAATTVQQQPVYGPAAPQPVKVPAPVKPAERTCAPGPTERDSQEIVVCAEKPQGYRIDRDVLAARKLKQQQLAGRPPPRTTFKDNG